MRCLPLVLLLAACGDLDGDGVFAPEDCDDSDPSVAPGLTEICGDGVDQDCDGLGCVLRGEHGPEAAGATLPGGAGQRWGATLLAHDFDHDGFDDLAIGAPGAGLVAVAWGSPEGPGAPQTLDLPEQEGAGAALAVIGDDLAVGVPGAGPLDEGDEGSRIAAGGLAVVSPAGGRAATWWPGAEPGDCAGASLATVPLPSGGQLLAVGAPCRGSRRIFHEHVQAEMLVDGGGAVLLLDRDLDLGAPLTTWASDRDWDRLGASLVATGDLDGDGQADLAAGAPDYYGAVWINHEATGRAWVLSTADRGGAQPWASLRGACCGESIFDEAGASLAARGDEFWIGAPRSADFGIDGLAFRVRDLEAGDTPLASLEAVLAGPPQPNRPARAGSAIALGDLDCDGDPDVAVGAPSEGSAGIDAGAVHVRYGLPDDFESLPGDLLWRSSTSGQQAGAALAIGDFDGDGCDELAVGAPGDAGGAGGAVYWIPTTSL